jgi:hypothetical protein
MESGNLNFLEPSGPLQACNGTVLPFIYIFVFVYLERNLLKVYRPKDVSAKHGRDMKHGRYIQQDLSVCMSRFDVTDHI